MRRIILVLTLSLLLCITNTYAEDYENTIPPEVLDSYEQSIVSGERPKRVLIKQSMIFDLRDKETLDADIYVLAFPIDEISTPQQAIVQNWVKKGNNVLLWGNRAVNLYANLFGLKRNIGKSISNLKLKESQTNAFQLVTLDNLSLADHPVNTGVSIEKLKYTRVTENTRQNSSVIALISPPPSTEAIISCNHYVLAGRIPYGKGNIYFASFDENTFSSGDRDRWTLNFYHWMLGYPIPEAK